MTCKHPNVRLTITFQEAAYTSGQDVETYRITPNSLSVWVASCPDCGLRNSTFNTNSTEWPAWLKERVRQIASGYSTVRLAVRTCLPDLLAEE